VERQQNAQIDRRRGTSADEHRRRICELEREWELIQAVSVNNGAPTEARREEWHER
jgi:hypothetical protein